MSHEELYQRWWAHRHAHHEAHAAWHHWHDRFHDRFHDRLHRRWHWHHRWDRYMHHRLHARFKHSLGARLTLVFLFLAAMGSLGTYLALQHSMSWFWLVPGLFLLSMMAYGSIRRMLSPLRALAYGAAAFGRGELSHRIRVRHRDEIGALAGRFNLMADDIQAMLDAKRGLLLAISHELRSPLTRARLNAELIEEGASQQAVIKELGVMRDLIESLLERERLDAGHTALSLQACDVRALVDVLVAARFGEAVQQGLLRVELAPDLPVSVQLDQPRVQVLIGNLLDNALRHHDKQAGQPATLSISIAPSRVADADGAVFSMSGSGSGPGASGKRGDGRPILQLTVRDHGPGVPEEELVKLGQPFYRPDSARTRQDGGVGLGLNLCHLIAVAHGGTLRMRNAKPGLEITVTLPA